MRTKSYQRPSNEEIDEYVRHSGLHHEINAGAKAAFTEATRVACERLAHDLKTPSIAQMSRDLVGLVTALDRAIDAPPTSMLIFAAAKRLAALSELYKDWIRHLILLRNRKSRPQVDGWDSTTAMQASFEQWRSLLTSGGAMVPGRNRPGGKVSVSRMRFDVILPELPSAGRPPQEAARNFIVEMRLAFTQAGGDPPLKTHHKTPTSFAHFIEMLTGNAFSADEMINALAREHEAAEAAIQITF